MALFCKPNTYRAINMISKNSIKLIKSLEKKKFRDEYSLFVAEGDKCVSELLKYFDCHSLYATKAWITEKEKTTTYIEINEISADELKRASLLKNPKDVIALFHKPHKLTPRNELAKSLSIVLDEIQDPGNLGTIIRLADWFGIENILCSQDTADVYNPKTVQATMGALGRVNVTYCDLERIIKDMPKDFPVYGTFLEGENIYSSELTGNGFIVMGNEGNGISKEISGLVTKKIHIPNYPAGRKTSESLNVAIATSIVCAEFRRRML